MSSRDAIFGRIANALDGHPERQDKRALARRLSRPKANLIPDRSATDHDGQVALFLAKCEEAHISVDQLPDMEAVPGAVSEWMAGHNLPQELVVSPDPVVRDLGWAEKTPLLTVRDGAAEITDQTSVTPAFGGVAETGTLFMQSSGDTPATLNFVPDNHVVVLRRDQVAGSMEDMFARLRQQHGSRSLPRTINMISGPSKTGDVEQKIVMGAHGPRRLHILLVDGEDT